MGGFDFERNLVMYMIKALSIYVNVTRNRNNIVAKTLNVITVAFNDF